MAENMVGKYPVMIDGRAVGTLEVSRHGAVTVFDVRCRMLEGIVRISVYGQASEGYLGVLAPEGEGLRLCRSLSPAAMRTFPRDIVEAGPAGLGRASIPVLPDAPERPGESDANTGGEYAAAPGDDRACEDAVTAKSGDAGRSLELQGGSDTVPAAEGGSAAVRTDSGGEMDASVEAARYGAAGACPDKMSDDRPGEPAEGSGEGRMMHGGAASGDDRACGDAATARPGSGAAGRSPELQECSDAVPAEAGGINTVCRAGDGGAAAGGQEGKNAAGTCPGGGEEELYWYSSPDGALVCFDGERSLIALPLGDGRIPRNIEGQLRTVEGKKYMVYITKNGRIVD